MTELQAKYSSTIKEYSTVFMKYAYWTFIPGFLKDILMWFTNKKWYDLKKEVIQFLEKDTKITQDNDKIEALKWLKKNPLAVGIYNPITTVSMKDIKVFKDNSCNMPYILYESKRLYFPENWESLRIKVTIFEMLREQDINSPHRYEHDIFSVKQGDVVSELGVAEGLFSLSVVEKASRLYLFECDEMWISVLQKTFEPWKEKVTIINKFISDFTDETHITMDDFLKNVGGEVNFVKADIEGAEGQFLNGAQKTLAASKDLRLALCTYHRQQDEHDIKKVLEGNGFITEYSNGFLFLFNASDELKQPYLRRGVIRGRKN